MIDHRPCIICGTMHYQRFACQPCYDTFNDLHLSTDRLDRDHANSTTFRDGAIVSMLHLNGYDTIGDYRESLIIDALGKL